MSLKVVLTAAALTFSICVCQTVFARQPLTFEERVKAQEAIEQVYYNHRIWPKENPTPKPPFERMVTRAMVEAKVTNYLKESAALGEFWQRPITGEQLQAEMDRMAKGSKDPATLKELFAALGNDPYLIAECLARPILADREIRNWYANDERFHAETKASAEAALAEAGGGSLSLCNEGKYQKVVYVLSPDGKEVNPGAPTPQSPIALDVEQFRIKLKESPDEGALAVMRDTPGAFLLVRTVLKAPSRIELELLVFPKRDLEAWLKSADLERFIQPESSVGYAFVEPGVSALACGQEGWDNGVLDDVPDSRSNHSAVWTGSEMIVWGGALGGSALNSGGRYNPATDSWTSTSSDINVPSPRSNHTAVWTGTQMIVWGGHSSELGMVNTGGRYDPASDSWLPTSIGISVPSSREGHTAVWTGSRMIIWGGDDATGYLNSGGCYDPSGNSWTATSTGANVPSARTDHTAIWTGSAMIVWGGFSYTTQNNFFNSGGIYDPTSSSWIPTSIGSNVPVARIFHRAVWTGSEMIIWGGQDVNSNAMNTGGRYNPTNDSWLPTSIGANVPAGRYGHTAVWTGTKMIVWGGYGYNTGGCYDPLSDSWVATSTGINVPMGRDYCTAVWTGSEMIIWGGSGGNGSLNSGGRYNPSNDSWLPTSLGKNVPSSRFSHTAVWTGAEMVIWGGRQGLDGVCEESGGRYCLATDSWRATSTGANVPSARYCQTAIWTGAEMIIWGGQDANDYVLGTGGRYNPADNSWKPGPSGTNAPSARSGHTAVWTGTEMTVWGGRDGAGGSINTGGRYNPSSDTWASTSIGTNCPSARLGHSAVWTGTVMIIWGGVQYDASTYSYTFLNTGGRYNPSSDSWLSTSTGTNVPSVRDGHTAVWTGSQMIIWGGNNGNTDLNTGGRYTLSTNSWQPTSTGVNLPSARFGHAAVWTGTKMLVWGGSLNVGTGGGYNPSSNSWQSIPAGGGAPLGRYGHSAIWTSSAMIVWGGEINLDFPLGSGGRYMPSGPVPSEVPNTSLFWDSTGKDTLSWSSASCATGYRVYRGAPSDLVNLNTGASACRAYDGTSTTTGAVLTADPPAGSFYWYLAVGYDASGEGPAGQGSYEPRMVLNTGTCSP